MKPPEPQTPDVAVSHAEQGGAEVKDLQGRAYLIVAETKVGTMLEADGDFTCMKKGAILKVKDHPEYGLFVDCKEGRHGLGGQLSDDGSHYVGFYPAETKS